MRLSNDSCVGVHELSELRSEKSTLLWFASLFVMTNPFFVKPQRALSSTLLLLSLASSATTHHKKNITTLQHGTDDGQWTHRRRPIMMTSRCSFASDYLNSSGKQFANAIQHLKFPPASHPSPGRSTIDD